MQERLQIVINKLMKNLILNHVVLLALNLLQCLKTTSQLY